jgi:hypothetical protein
MEHVMRRLAFINLSSHCSSHQLDFPILHSETGTRQPRTRGTPTFCSTKDCMTTESKGDRVTWNSATGWWKQDNSNKHLFIFTIITRWSWAIGRRWSWLVARRSWAILWCRWRTRCTDAYPSTFYTIWRRSRAIIIVILIPGWRSWTVAWWFLTTLGAVVWPSWIVDQLTHMMICVGHRKCWEVRRCCRRNVRHVWWCHWIFNWCQRVLVGLESTVLAVVGWCFLDIIFEIMSAIVKE